VCVCCSVLQHDAVCCSMLQCVRVLECTPSRAYVCERHSVSQRVVVCCSMLQCVRVYSLWNQCLCMLQHVAACCIVAQCVTVSWSELEFVRACHNALGVCWSVLQYVALW